jgi:hypothetical protein
MLVSAGFLLVFVCVGFTFTKELDYQVMPVRKLVLEQKFHPSSVKIGTFLYTESKNFEEAFIAMPANEIDRLDFKNNRYVYIQFAEQNGCKEEIDVIQEVRKYKHYYEVILVPASIGICKTKVKPYQLMAIPNDRLPVLIKGSLPE